MQVSDNGKRRRKKPVSLALTNFEHVSAALADLEGQTARPVAADRRKSHIPRFKTSAARSRLQCDAHDLLKRLTSGEQVL